MEACLTRCCNGGSFLRALKPLHSRLSKPLTCSLSSSNLFSGTVRRAYDGLLSDAGGTLLQLAKPVEETYASIGANMLDLCLQRFSCLNATPAEIKQGFKRDFAAPSWPEKLRYQLSYFMFTDREMGGHFWKLAVSEATGCSDIDYFEEVYEYYANGDAWHLLSGAYETIVLLKDARVKVAVVFNFDKCLRKLLKDLNVLDLFDVVIVSSEVEYEKPDSKILEAALDRINVEACKAVHVGDDEKAGKDGANAIGIDYWLWGKDVKTFSDVQTE